MLRKIKGSFAWKSILKGRELIKHGLKWRIGNGSQVRIFHDAWLLGSRQGKVLSPAIESHASLINHVDRCWKVVEIDSLFDQDDLPFWPYTRDGVFSVKLSYCLLMEQDELKLLDTPNGGVNSNVWKTIWCMRVPNWVKSLMWRAGTNSLPTRVNLLRRQILTEAMCSECKVQPEDTLHALWSCPNLKDVWKVHFSKLMTETGTCSSSFEILECASIEKLHLIFLLWWSLNFGIIETRSEWVRLCCCSVRFLPRHMVLSKNFSNYAPFILKFQGQPVQ